MGQFVSKNCIDCNSSLTTQEDVLHESTRKSVRMLREIIESMQEEVVEFESPRNKDTKSATQRSSININTSREIDQSASGLGTFPRSSSNPFLHSIKRKDRGGLYQHSLEGEFFGDSPSTLDNSYFFGQSRYKTRSSNFSLASANLVDNVRRSPSPKRNSKLR
ncbi:hypothetical protein SteCoe_36823 [Stentor coeruleus]|uniref:Uncharacterized protein n=1 Tax=Stentor coeruleus TaxID=5963 RepID=A0A1R2APA4_9CILI|nr:hypothetical protein SteCoe_36823 [Stentor coeruleus]